MLLRVSQLLFIIIAVSTALMPAAAQPPDNQGPLVSKPGEGREEYPKSFREMMVKMRIEKEKKEYQQMLDRGEEVLKLTEELENGVEQNGQLTKQEYDKVESVEKLVKKIRNELGGDDDEKDNKDLKGRLSPREAVKSLRLATVEFIEELKKTTRFSISAAAIESSNAVLRVARFLRITN